MNSPLASVRQALALVRGRFDAWTNSVMGFGTSADKTAYNRPAPFFQLSDIDLSNLYHGDDIAARAVDVIPQEMLREGFTVKTGDPNRDAKLADKHRDLETRDALLEGEIWGRLFGGAITIIGADDKRPSALPLIPERVRSVDWLYTIDKRFIQPLTYYQDFASPKFGQVETYMIMGGDAVASANTVGFPIHESRVIRHGGERTARHEKGQLNGWDYSVLQRVCEVVGYFHNGWKSAGVLLSDGNQPFFKMTGLADMIAGGEKENLYTRLEVMNLYRSVVNALVLDADGNEDFGHKSVSFAGIPDLLDKLFLRLSAALQIPVTILAGQSPAGMNATGESDIRWFYDRVKSMQGNKLAPKVRRLSEIILASQEFAASSLDSVKVEFPPLWQPTPKEQEETRKLVAERDAAHINAGVLLPEEVAMSRYTEEGWSSETTIDLKLRKKLLKAEKERLLEPPKPPPVLPPPPPGTDPDDGHTPPEDPEQEPNDGGDEEQDPEQQPPPAPEDDEEDPKRRNA